MDRLIPTLLLAAALVGAYNHLPLLVSLSVTLLFLLLLTRGWSRRSLHALGYQRETSDDRAFPGDVLTLTLRLANRKLLPLPWVEVDDRIPGQLSPTPVGGEAVAGGEESRLRLGGSVAWHERISWHYRLLCQRRGIYPLGPAVVTSGDPFGFFPRSARIGQVQRLVVYPRLLPLERLGLPSGFPLGETRPQLWIFEDPSRTVGVRDYRREDPFRRIHWKATARRQQLQVRLHEPTTTLETAIFLGVDTFAGPRAADRETDPRPPAMDPHFEHAVSVVASLAHLLIGQRHPVGVYLNGGAAGSSDPVQLPPGGSQGQLIRILELLAGVEPVACRPIEVMVAEVAPRLPWGSSLVAVVGSLSESLLSALQDLGRTGTKPAVLLAGEGPARGCEGVAVHSMGVPREG